MYWHLCVNNFSGKQIIPAGANIALPLYMIHQDPSIYPNPMEWNPSNFDPNRVAQRHNCSFVPFSSGPRGCIGKKTLSKDYHSIIHFSYDKFRKRILALSGY